MAKKQAVPKSVAGVPVPQAVRRSSAVKSLLASPLGKKVLTDAMLAAAGAAAAVLLKRKRGEAKNTDITKEVLRAAAGAVTVGLGRAALSQLGPQEGVQLAAVEQRGGTRAGGRAKKAAGRKSARKGAAKKSAAKKTRKTKRAS